MLLSSPAFGKHRVFFVCYFTILYKAKGFGNNFMVQFEKNTEKNYRKAKIFLAIID